MGTSRWINEVLGADGQARGECAVTVPLVAASCAGTIAALDMGVDGLTSGIAGAL